MRTASLNEPANTFGDSGRRLEAGIPFGTETGGGRAVVRSAQLRNTIGG
jgi:hypothetical protein